MGSSSGLGMLRARKAAAEAGAVGGGKASAAERLAARRAAQPAVKPAAGKALTAREKLAARKRGKADPEPAAVARDLTKPPATSTPVDAKAAVASAKRAAAQRMETYKASSAAKRAAARAERAAKVGPVAGPGVAAGGGGATPTAKGIWGKRQKAVAAEQAGAGSAADVLAAESAAVDKAGKPMSGMEKLRAARVPSPV